MFESEVLPRTPTFFCLLIYAGVRLCLVIYVWIKLCWFGIDLPVINSLFFCYGNVSFSSDLRILSCPCLLVSICKYLCDSLCWAKLFFEDLGLIVREYCSISCLVSIVLSLWWVDVFAIFSSLLWAFWFYGPLFCSDPYNVGCSPTIVGHCKALVLALSFVPCAGSCPLVRLHIM